MCLPQGLGSQCRKEDNCQLRTDGIGRGDTVRYHLRQVSGTCFCGHYIDARTTRWTVTGQLGFHRKAKGQEA